MLARNGLEVARGARGCRLAAVELGERHCVSPDHPGEVRLVGFERFTELGHRLDPELDRQAVELEQLARDHSASKPRVVVVLHVGGHRVLPEVHELAHALARGVAAQLEHTGDDGLGALFLGRASHGERLQLVVVRAVAHDVVEHLLRRVLSHYFIRFSSCEEQD